MAKLLLMIAVSNKNRLLAEKIRDRYREREQVYIELMRSLLLVMAVTVNI